VDTSQFLVEVVNQTFDGVGRGCAHCGRRIDEAPRESSAGESASLALPVHGSAREQPHRPFVQIVDRRLVGLVGLYVYRMPVRISGLSAYGFGS
jgi:hypothetical protein